MADLRINGGLPTAQPAQQSQAVRSAQRAFFQAALNNVAPTAATRPAETQPQAAPARTAQPAAASTAAEPTRYMRPGSLLDIKV